MKKMYLFAAVVIAAVAGTICYNHESDSQMSDMAKENVKALASDDGHHREDCMDGQDLCEMLVIYPDGDYGFDIELGVKKPGWL